MAGIRKHEMIKQMNSKPGIFYGIGVGPGDPELLTLKAVQILQKVDIVVAPKTEKKEGSVALSIARPHLPAGVEIVYQTFPMVKNFQSIANLWAENTAAIEQLVKTGKRVAFLTLGDPFLYSTFIYLHRLLKGKNVPMEVVPGITSFCAIASKYQYPLANGEDVLSIVPGTVSEGKLQQILTESDTAVIMKVYKNWREIVTVLQKNGRAEEAILVSRCGLDAEKSSKSLSELKTAPNYLSTILVGRNVK